MSVFLRDLLKTDGKVTMDVLQDRVSLINNEITKLKSLTNDSMKDRFVELETNLKPDKMLLDTSERLIKDMKILENRIDNEIITKLTGSSKELQNLSLQLKEYNYSMHLSDHLLNIYRALSYIEACKNNKQTNEPCANIAKILVELQKLVIEENFDVQQLNIYVPLKEEYFKVNENFTEKLARLWHENIFWDDKRGSLNKKSVSLCIKCQKDQLSDIVQALYLLNKLQKYVEQLSSKILHHFISPIVNFECLVTKSENLCILEILDKKQLPSYKSVLGNLRIIFEFLHSHFDISIGGEECLLAQISNLLFPEFSSLLTANCIFKILPTSTAEIETFKNIVLEVEDFQNYLIDVKFINKEQKFLSNYTNNIDELYIDRKIEKLLETARNIIKKDLHDSVRYKPEDFKCFEFIEEERMKNSSKIFIDNKLSDSLFHFPECQISKSAPEILGLIEEILEEACQNTDKYLPKLFHTIRNIFEMYATLVPEIHKSYLDTIPQQVALFHNNCLFLSHYLLTLSYKHRKQMTTSSQDFSLTFADQHLLLREVGFRYFLSHMKYQRDMIFEILRESGLTAIGQMPELPASTERALRQCIRQLELLKTVWIEILPIKVYNRVMGCIIDNMIDDIATKVISVEDIPADVASELVVLFNMVVKRTPQIFLEPQSIEQHVHKWRKLKELILILGVSLREIEDRWADGKGPLATEFSAQHVKQLIRALFQNTERRSHLLSRIKDK